jgi:hypothetical protein
MYHLQFADKKIPRLFYRHEIQGFCGGFFVRLMARHLQGRFVKCRKFMAEICRENEEDGQLNER